MMLRYTIPIDIYALGPWPDALALGGAFEDGQIRVKYRPVGHLDPFEVPDLPPPEHYVKHCSGLEIELNDQGSQIDVLVEGQNWSALIPILVTIANRILRGIRNTGRVAHVSELKINLSEAEKYIERWLVTVDDAAGAPRTLVRMQDDPFAGFIASVRGGTATPSGELRVGTWLDITEAIAENQPPAPEQEFFVNAIEHMRLDNLRYALLEAVICLEIVLARYLSLFFQLRGVPNDRIKEFLGPKLGLRDRVTIMLELTVGHEALRKIDLQKVIGAINWRNVVVHQTGHLPPHLKDKDTRDGIIAVLALATVLAGKRNELQAAPELQVISQEISKELGGGFSKPFPVLKSPGGHYVVVEFRYIAADTIPAVEELERIVDRVAEKLERRDARFQRDQHLTVDFVAFPDDVHARWRNGRLITR